MNHHQRQFFRSIAIFDSLSDDSLDEVMAGFHVRIFARNEFLFMEGDAPNGFYIVAAGQVRLYKTSPRGREFTIAIHRDRQFFDLAPLFDAKAHPVSAQALTNARVYATTFSHMREMMVTFSTLNRSLELQVVSLLRRMAFIASELAFTDVSARLARLLIISARNDGRRTPAGVMLGWGLSQSEIGHLLGAAREVVSRNLRNMERQGLVERTHNGILIRDWQGLSKVARASEKV